jgi:uncharacterized protein DUF3293
MPDASLDAAYRSTDYIADYRSEQICLRIGEPCPSLEARAWAYVTACNPQSKLLPPYENAQRMQNLEQVVAAAGYRYLHGEARSRGGNWPPEPSLLILDIDEKAALDLARRFDQAAIVVGRSGESARLVWIDDCSPANSP